MVHLSGYKQMKQGIVAVNYRIGWIFIRRKDRKSIPGEVCDRSNPCENSGDPPSAHASQ